MDWCTRALGAPAEVLFVTGNLSRVVGLRLDDGRAVVVKVRPGAARHRGCIEVQRHLAARGYPCPRPLAGPDRIGTSDVTAETYRPGGRLLPLDDTAPARFAAALAQSVRLAPGVDDVPSLDPPPPWAAWDHAGAGLWPRPASTVADLNAPGGPEWLDEAAAQARRRLAAGAGPAVAGHVDFESQNVRWRTGRLHCVHDWDSAAARPEAAVAGIAAACFPAVDSNAAMTSVADGTRFLAAYAEARGRPWTHDEHECAWAAGLWSLAYNAKIELAEGRSGLATKLERDVELRLSLVG